MGVRPHAAQRSDRIFDFWIVFGGFPLVFPPIWIVFLKIGSYSFIIGSYCYNLGNAMQGNNCIV
ncbi:hypothetical protein [Virgibacillus oceani]|uniref:hypothetical protein n=1 Tax=Virgibacillus oceani TaxID=1479511 RepID=UPI001664670F|nr:hypothetical protein [Virgibacillus oceani]